MFRVNLYLGEIRNDVADGNSRRQDTQDRSTADCNATSELPCTRISRQAIFRASPASARSSARAYCHSDATAASCRTLWADIRRKAQGARNLEHCSGEHRFDSQSPREGERSESIPGQTLPRIAGRFESPINGTRR